MKMEIQYAREWSHGLRKLLHPIEETEAREMHQVKKSYALAIRQGIPLTHSIEVNNTILMVGFLTENFLPYLQYVFSEVEPGNIFLTEANYITYQEDGTTRKTVQTFFFWENGKMNIRNANLETGKVEVSRDNMGIDMATNWDHYPEFGDYTHLLQEDRKA